MDATLLELLRCPFCGGRLSPLPGFGAPAVDAFGPAGIVGCQCCAYPVVAGIPYLVTGPVAETAMQLIGDRQLEAALSVLLGLTEVKRERFNHLLSGEPRATFRGFLELLCPGAEGDYLFHRFSDPTFLCSQVVLRAVGQDRRSFGGPVLDVCGGTGHLTRSLSELAGSVPVVLADLSFAKLWLARRFIAPCCLPVCCSAADPLPFAAAAFSLVVCSDAFHYIWPRRLLACEMIRLLTEGGTIILPHLHNQLGDNCSAGMPLPPAGYRDLFAGLDVRLFKESRVFADLLARRRQDFSAGYSDEELGAEAALVLIATRLTGLFRVYDVPPAGRIDRPLARNPLYAVEQHLGTETWTLRFPSAGYELEYGRCREYLPERISLPPAELDRLRGGNHGGGLQRLAEQFVLIDLPEGYD